jgi:hypothetical protein
MFHKVARKGCKKQGKCVGNPYAFFYRSYRHIVLIVDSVFIPQAFLATHKINDKNDMTIGRIDIMN